MYRPRIAALASTSILLVALAVLLVPRPVSSTSVVRFTFQNLCGTAKRIAHVVCLESTTLATDDAAGVRTQTRFRVIERVKGEADGREFILTLPGGEFEGRSVSVPGVPSFAAGEELVIFLSEADAYGSPWPMGLNQGCYRVTRDAAGKPSVVLQHGVTPIPESPAYKPASGRPYAVGLGQFLAEVRASAGEGEPVRKQ